MIFLGVDFTLSVHCLVRQWMRFTRQFMEFVITSVPETQQDAALNSLFRAVDCAEEVAECTRLRLSTLYFFMASQSPSRGCQNSFTTRARLWWRTLQVRCGRKQTYLGS